MRAIRKIVVAGATTATLVGMGLGMGASANADPASLPSLTTLAGVGSDTTTPVFAGLPTENTAGSLAFDYNATSPTYPVASWDATGSSPIVTKGSSGTDNTCSMTRPNGSSSGIAALNLNVMDSGHYCIDFARSSRAANTSSFKDTFVSLAKDAITWSYPKISGVTNPQPATLTRAQLIAIYTCNSSDRTWNQVGGSSTASIVPVLPQSGSGTLATFLAALGNITPGSCVVNGTSGGLPIEENTGQSSSQYANTTLFTASGAQNDLFPYSIGDNIAQGPVVHGSGTGVGAATVGGHVGANFGHGTLVLASITDDGGTVRAPIVTNSSSQPQINTSFAVEFDRTLYDVVRNGFVNPTGPSNAAFPTTPAEDASGLSAVFGSTGWICKQVAGQSDLVSYGFLNLGGACGALTAGD